MYRPWDVRATEEASQFAAEEEGNIERGREGESHPRLPRPGFPQERAGFGSVRVPVEEGKGAGRREGKGRRYDPTNEMEKNASVYLSLSA